ncbi:spindle pole body protein [Flagelloscypha sp. PMI_526]|nr:spindle pole body protein [Flagelloscypha sp. PMI_526]
MADSERPAKRQVSTEPPPVVHDSEDDEDEIIIDEADARPTDLYLDTYLQRTSTVYGCLVCGKYFQGKGPKSYAYSHSIDEDHHVFLNLETAKAFSDPSLEDIRSVLAPSFTREAVSILSSPSYLSKQSYDLAHNAYLPGYVGLNNIKHNDHVNVVIHALLHVAPLRDYLLLSNLVGKEPELAEEKLWNPKLFKAQVSPHEFLQEVNRASGGKFRLEKQGDPVEFLSWLLNRLHIDMGGTRKRNSSPIFSVFQGELRVEIQQVLVQSASGGTQKPRFDIDRAIKTNSSPFLFLAVDLPPPPLFQDAVEKKNIIPQVSIHSVLSKYDGFTTQESGGQLRRYKCKILPQYIILHFKRFTNNNFVDEKNPTIVTFPLRGLDFADYVDTPSTTTIYDLVANIVHESVAGTTRDKEHTVWKVHGEGEKWLQLQDLMVEETRKEMIFLGETVLQIWERRAPSA